MPASNSSALVADICPLGKRCVCSRLPPRQRQVFHRLLLGDSEKQAASAMGISAHTLHVHTKRLYRRFNVSGRLELMPMVLKKTALVRPRAIKHNLGLEETQRQHLLGLANASAGTSQQESKRARIFLQCDGTRNDYDIAEEVHVSIRTIERLRHQYVKTGLW